MARTLSLPKPRPENYRTGAEYRWAKRAWRKRTGGSLITTVLLAAIFGALTGSPTLLWGTIALALLFHLALRKADGDPHRMWQELKPPKRSRK